MTNETKPCVPARYRAAARRRGNAVLEAALVFPILISLTFGCIEFGHFFYVKHTLQGAAREGARAAATPTSTSSDVTTAVNNAMAATGISSTKYTTTIRNSSDTANVDPSTATAGTAILVKVTATWGQVGMRPLGLISSSKSVVGQTTMRKEG